MKAIYVKPGDQPEEINLPDGAFDWYTVATELLMGSIQVIHLGDAGDQQSFVLVCREESLGLAPSARGLDGTVFCGPFLVHRRWNRAESHDMAGLEPGDVERIRDALEVLSR